jgi:hypothetical protein
MLRYIKSQLEHDASFIFGRLFISVSMIPFLGFPQFDSQPFPLLVAIIFIILMMRDHKFILPNKYLIYYLFFIVVGCYIAYLIDNEFNIRTIRGCAGYLSIFIYYLAYDNFIRNFGFPLRLIQTFIFIWIIVGVYQLFNPVFGSSFIAQRITESRGVTSLSPEPTHFGIFIFFSCWLLLLSRKYKIDITNKLIIFFGLLAILFLAKSFMTLLYIIFAILFYSIYLLARKKYSTLFLYILVMITIIIPIGIDFNNSNRILLLTTSLLRGNFEFFLADSSSLSRFNDILFPLVALFKNNFMPGGFSSFGKNFYVFSNFFFIPEFIHGKKIMSWCMSMWYELGFLGVFAWLSLIMIHKKNVTLRSFLEVSYLFSILLTAIPALFPLPIMVMTLIRYNND